MNAPLLEIRDLFVSFAAGGESVPVLRGVDLSLDQGEALALVGPSGCGKSLTARAVCGLLPRAADWSGEIRWERLGSPLATNTTSPVSTPSATGPVRISGVRQR